jgi:hypothetical protein
VVSGFFEMYSQRVRHGSNDTICWIPSKRKTFEVKSYYQVLSNDVRSCLPYKNIWKVKVPSRVAFFVWTVVLGKTLTLNNLRKRHVIVMEWCCMCKKCEGSIDHLFLHCEFATGLWNAIFQLFGVDWVMP